MQMAGKTQQIFLERVEVQIFLTDDISSADPGCEQEICSSLRKELEQTPSVVAVQYLNREDAVKDATERVFKDQPELAALVSPDSFRRRSRSSSVTRSDSASSTTPSVRGPASRVCSISASWWTDSSACWAECATQRSRSRSSRRSRPSC
ncbi:hypothetical protein GCM10020255_070960 [Rhodococcus baikonurensis]